MTWSRVSPDGKPARRAVDEDVTRRSPTVRTRAMVSIDDARAVASTLPRSYEAIVRGRLKFRVGRLVYVAFSRDESIMGFAFPKEWRHALVESEPDKFLCPPQSDLRYNWVCVRLESIDHDELHALVVSAWQMCVPKKVAAAHLPHRVARGNMV